MNERHKTKIAVFGGKPGERMEFKGAHKHGHRLIGSLFLTSDTIGMSGNQVLEWADLDTEIKTAGVKGVSVWFCDLSGLTYGTFSGSFGTSRSVSGCAHP